MRDPYKSHLLHLKSQKGGPPQDRQTGHVTTSHLDIRPVTYFLYDMNISMYHALASQLAVDDEAEVAELDEALALGAEDDEAA